MIYRTGSKKTLDEIGVALEAAAARHKFGILGIHDLKQTLAKKGVELAMECRIFEVCNPSQAKKVLDADGAVSTALPCRISVYGSAGNYTLATMLPTEMMKAFGNPAMEPVAKEVEETILAMMDEAAAG
ncbi:MAG: DUF302 domain-containing protein [Bryobacteraceae bacterium]